MVPFILYDFLFWNYRLPFARERIVCEKIMPSNQENVIAMAGIWWLKSTIAWIADKVITEIPKLGRR